MCCRMDPLWNSLVIGGLQDGKPFLGTVGMLGTHYTDQHIATGASNVSTTCSELRPWLDLAAGPISNTPDCCAEADLSSCLKER